MALAARLPGKTLTGRGWGFIIAGVLTLIFADSLGRRDLLYLGVFLLVLPLLSIATVKLMKPRFTVSRNFSPGAVSTGVTARVQLSLTASGKFYGPATFAEGLPASFGRAPIYTFPGGERRSASTCSYEYRLRSSSRGMFPIGPLTAEFTDPFGLGRARHSIGGVDDLVVTPSPIDLPRSTLSGSRGLEGSAATQRQANPSNDDVMTREYRNGDPMRRVHWAATARHGELMVRQEESVSTPQATIILDRREGAHGTGYAMTGTSGQGGLRTSDSFEWCISASVSMALQFMEQGHAVRFLDQSALPALRSSPSSSAGEEEEFTGASGFHDISEGLAALELAGPSGSSAALGEPLVDKLAAQTMRGPLIALLGDLSTEDAGLLAPAAALRPQAFAIIVRDRPRSAQSAVAILRRGGWQAVAVSPHTSISAAWSLFEDRMTFDAPADSHPAEIP